MKKVFLLALTAVFTANFASAQCTPGPNYGNGIYPDTTTNFVHGCKDQPYEQVISIKVPADTNIVYNGVSVTAHFNYIKVNSVTGLPTGLSMACNPNNCTFLGNNVGCAVISGTTSQVGTHNLVFDLTANLTTDPIPIIGAQTINQPYTLTSYRIVIDDCGPGKIDEVTTNASFKVFPNPTSGNVTIANLSEVGVAKSIHLLNVEGKVIRTYFTTENELHFSTEELTNGVYFVKVMQKNSTEIVKLIVE